MAAQEPVPSAPDAKVDSAVVPPAMAAVLDANHLQREHNPPFHLKMSFQVFDLKGKPSEAGDIEYWWAGPDGTHLDVTSPSLGVVHDSGPETVLTPQGRRVLYLAMQLLDQMRDPGEVLAVPRHQLYPSAG